MSDLNEHLKCLLKKLSDISNLSEDASTSITGFLNNSDSSELNRKTFSENILKIIDSLQKVSKEVHKTYSKLLKQDEDNKDNSENVLQSKEDSREVSSLEDNSSNQNVIKGENKENESQGSGEKKPLLKIVDFNKLVDPKNLELMDKNFKSKENKKNKHNSSVIVLSSSEDETIPITKLPSFTIKKNNRQPNIPIPNVTITLKKSNTPGKTYSVKSISDSNKTKKVSHQISEKNCRTNHVVLTNKCLKSVHVEDEKLKLDPHVKLLRVPCEELKSYYLQKLALPTSRKSSRTVLDERSGELLNEDSFSENDKLPSRRGTRTLSNNTAACEKNSKKSDSSSDETSKNKFDKSRRNCSKKKESSRNRKSHKKKLENEGSSSEEEYTEKNKKTSVQLSLRSRKIDKENSDNSTDEALVAKNIKSKHKPVARSQEKTDELEKNIEKSRHINSNASEEELDEASVEKSDSKSKSKKITEPNNKQTTEHEDKIDSNTNESPDAEEFLPRITRSTKDATKLENKKNDNNSHDKKSKSLSKSKHKKLKPKEKIDNDGNNDKDEKVKDCLIGSEKDENNEVPIENHIAEVESSTNSVAGCEKEHTISTDKEGHTHKEKLTKITSKKDKDENEQGLLVEESTQLEEDKESTENNCHQNNGEINEKTKDSEEENLKTKKRQKEKQTEDDKETSKNKEKATLPEAEANVEGEGVTGDENQPVESDEDIFGDVADPSADKESSERSEEKKKNKSSKKSRGNKLMSEDSEGKKSRMEKEKTASDSDSNDSDENTGLSKKNNEKKSTPSSESDTLDNDRESHKSSKRDSESSEEKKKEKSSKQSRGNKVMSEDSVGKKSKKEKEKTASDADSNDSDENTGLSKKNNENKNKASSDSESSEEKRKKKSSKQSRGNKVMSKDSRGKKSRKEKEKTASDADSNDSDENTALSKKNNEKTSAVSSDSDTLDDDRESHKNSKKANKFSDSESSEEKTKKKSSKPSRGNKVMSEDSVGKKSKKEKERTSSDADSNDSDENTGLSKKNKEKKGAASSDSESLREKNADKSGDDKSTDSDTGKKRRRKKSSEEEDAVITVNSADSEDSEDFDFATYNRKRGVNVQTRTQKRIKRLVSDSDGEIVKSDKNSESEKEEANESENSSKSDKEKDSKVQRKRIRRMKSNDSSDSDPVTTRKKIKKLISKDSLSDKTKKAAADERERKQRIMDKQKKYNQIYEGTELANSKVEKLVLDVDEATDKPLLQVSKSLVSKLKPHQASGIQFMWDACFESLKRSKTNGGSGCILAHCMGLGKTLQVIALINTLLEASEETKIKSALVVTPLSTVLNWKAEFQNWLPDDTDYEIFELVSVKQNVERACYIRQWHENGGVMIMSYAMFRNLSQENNKKISKKSRTMFVEGLVNPGPDLVICDEGHLLKNEKTGLSIAMNKIKTRRRIVLTGTPLQNNLKEYYCMVQFVKPNLLGTYKEYMNRFVNPITNGQYTDSTQYDINIMRRRSHVLHKMLDGIVQRRDYAVLAPYLPPKFEYVLFLTLTETQKKLYQHYIDHLARKASDSSNKTTSYLFKDFQAFSRICIHPRVLLDKSVDDQMKNQDTDEESIGSLKDFIDDSSESTSTPEESSASSSESGSEGGKKKKKKKKKKGKSKRITRAQAAARKSGTESSEEEEEEVDQGKKEWWQEYCDGDELDNLAHSTKLLLLFEILKECEQIGDKVLVFSQSLYALNVIEYFLEKVDQATQNGDTKEKTLGYSGSWTPGLDYFRLDGSTNCSLRSNWCDSFNKESNTRARLFLLSTRAGGLGINLVGANRVIIFDVSWNPSSDTQSIYRVYRFGQLKPSYIYRFVMYGTMEMKIYERQVTKQAISKRVIDEQQIDRHYNQNDLAELYKFEVPEADDRPIPMVPKDVLLGEMLQHHEDKIFKYHEHQSLLENKEDETLNEEERKAAWDEFENEKVERTTKMSQIGKFSLNTVHIALRSIIQRDNPTWNNNQILSIIPQLIQQLKIQLAAGDATMYNRIAAEVRLMQEEYSRKMQMQFANSFNNPFNNVARLQMALQQQQQRPNFAAMFGPQNIQTSRFGFPQFMNNAPNSFAPAAGPSRVSDDVLELN